MEESQRGARLRDDGDRLAVARRTSIDVRRVTLATAAPGYAPLRAVV